MNIHQPVGTFVKQYLLLLIALCPLLSAASGPFLKFTTISRDNGLSNSTINCIVQDSKGFMWFGTNDGLNKYDGYQMMVYKYNAQNKSSISDNYIRHIYEDRQKNLWVGTSNGLNLFDREKGIFITYKHQVNKPGSLSDNSISSIHEDHYGNLWIGTYHGGLNIFNRQTKKFTVFKRNTGNQSLNYVNYIFEDRDHNLWVAAGSGLNRFNYKTNKFSEELLIPNFRANIRVMQQAPNGDFWIGTENSGIYVVSTKTKMIRHLDHIEKDASSIGSNSINDLIFDHKGNLWVGCVNGGLNLLTPGSSGFHHYAEDPVNKPGALQQKTVSALFEDNQGNLWIGTHRGGVKLYAPKSQNFEFFQHEDSKNSLSYNDVKAFYEDPKGNIWIGTDGGGLNKYNRSDNSFKHYRYNAFDKSSISCDAVLDIIDDNRGNLLIATWGGGLNVFNEKTGTFKRLLNNPNDNSSISSNHVYKVLKDRKGNFWIGTYNGGLNRYNPDNHTFSKITRDPQNITSFLGYDIVSLNEDKKGNIWIGTDDAGLNCFDVTTNSFRHYFLSKEKNPIVEVIYTDSKGRVWAGQSGLYLYNEENDKFDLYPKNSILASEFIKGIVEDESGSLWISTLNGLFKFNPDKGTYKKYNKADGLQSEEFSANAFLKSRDGKLFFGGIRGFNSFYPQNILINNFIPKVYLTEFQIFNKKITPLDRNSPLKSDINTAKEIILKHDQSTFALSFAALNYTATSNNLYAYKLEGFDKQWISIGHDRKAFYTNIDPGTYIFKVKGSNNDGIWNNHETTITIIIRPPYWQTLWFRILTGLILITVAYYALSFKRKLELDKLEKLKKEELHQIQLQFFTNISHDLRTPLTLIMGRLERLIKEDAGATAGRHFASLFKNANRLMNLINELMDFKKVESSALSLKVARGNIDVFIDEITDEFVVLAHEKQLSLSFKKNLTITDTWFDRQILEKIALNLIHNAIKYTSAGGKVTVEIADFQNMTVSSYKNELLIKNEHQSKQYLAIKVTDTGIGIDKDSLKHLFERYYRITESHLGSGIGLAFVKSLVALHKGEIYVYSEKNKGTEVIIKIPCLRDDYNESEIWNETLIRSAVRLESVIPVLQYTAEPSSTAVDDLMEEVNTHTIKKHILIVDDNPEIIELLKDSLSNNYQISAAADGANGITKAKAEYPDLIISDIMMPGMNGIDFCRLIKEDLETSHIPFLLLTARDNIDSKIEGVESGADYYFSKPINFKLLCLTIKNIFEQRHKLKNHYAKDHQIEVRELVHSARDKEFIDKLLLHITENMSDPYLDADFLSAQMCMSKTKLYNKIKSITGQSIGEFIRTMRLQKAKEIMIHEDIFITDVMYRVGMQTQSYFTRAFKKEFGKTPTQFIQK
ncbi:hybrid sensor histidine kinase/response regulator transcription factor [Pedobacter metabolipauper]|uniref:histidine kinase n=1 Tax=Pedobacter metabolipauper TaxID=425513 RepID=A0A4R6STA7_9SPHI|nr:hybrid sensor histidine kinase/response regulator transcription factor [Pedobacter metabolipauper]TDQ08665.1 signal transduction histidine kinase [Pedobacter metabolipauper]